VQVRLAEVHEVPAVVAIGRRAYESATGKTDFNEAVSAGNWVCLLQSGKGVIFIVVEDSGEPVGMICGYKSRNIDTGKWVAQMWHWFVEPAATGYGGHLLKRFEGWAKEQGCEEISLTCFPQLWTERHRGIYERMGYKLDGLIFNKEK